MAFRAGITTKRLANKRFKRTEEAMLRSFCNGKDSMSKIATDVGVARSTVYNHHKAAGEIVPDYEKYILLQYRRMIKKMMRFSGVRVRTIYFRTLCFVLINRKIFGMLILYNEERVFCKMVGVLRVKLMDGMRLPKKSQRLFAVYVSEVARLLYEWGSAGFSEDEIDKVLTEVMYLTKTARERLGILLD